MLSDAIKNWKVTLHGLATNTGQLQARA